MQKEKRGDNLPHCFEVEIAEKYGILEAILLNYFRFWIQKNEANNVHYHDGKYWTYNSIKAFCEMFPYASKKMIERAINHLIEEGLLVTGNYNKSAYDRTKWYALTENGKCISSTGEMECSEKGNGFPTEGKPIPVNNTEKEPFGEPFNSATKEIVAYLNETTGGKYKPSSGYIKSLIHARMVEGFTVDDFKTVIWKKAREWKGTKFEQYLRPQTLFGTKFEAYLNQIDASQEDDHDALEDFMRGDTNEQTGFW